MMNRNHTDTAMANRAVATLLSIDTSLEADVHGVHEVDDDGKSDDEQNLLHVFS